MKDHELRQYINDLTQVAKDFGQTQQLRERIAILVKEIVAVEREYAMDEGYDHGYNDGRHEGYEDGYEDGKYDAESRLETQ